MSCPPRTSTTIHERQFTFAHGLGGESQSLADVFLLKIRERFENLGIRHPVRYHPNNRSYRYPQTPNTWKTVHLFGVDRNPLKLNVTPPSMARR